VTSLTTLLAIMKHTSRPKNAAVKRKSMSISPIFCILDIDIVSILAKVISTHLLYTIECSGNVLPQRSHMLPLSCYRFTYHIMHGSGTFWVGDVWCLTKIQKRDGEFWILFLSKHKVFVHVSYILQLTWSVCSVVIMHLSQS